MSNSGGRSGRAAIIVSASVLAFGVAAVAAMSAYGAYMGVGRKADERKNIAALVQATLVPRAGVVPAAPSLDTPAVALTHRPMDAGALARAGLTAALAGDATKARALLGEALHRDPRSVPVRLWTLAAALRQNDPAGAVAQLDRLMIVARDHQDAFFPALAEVMKQPRAERAITRILAQKPEWRDWFLVYLTNTGQNPALVFRLAASAPNGTEGAKAQLLKKLVDGGKYDEAYLAWVNFLPESALGQVATVYDGGFAGLAGPKPFNWSFDDTQASSVGIEPDEGLQIDYPAGQNVQMANQTIVLKPGRYRLDYVAHGSPETPDGGAISWHVACLPDKSVALDLPIRGLRDKPARYSASFTVSPACQAQILSIEGMAGTFPQSRSVEIRSIAITALAS